MPVTITFAASISDRKTAIQRSGLLEGGGAVTLDLPETELGALAALLPLARVPLRITVEVDAVSVPDTETPGEIPGASKPRWARRG